MMKSKEITRLFMLTVLCLLTAFSQLRAQAKEVDVLPRFPGCEALADAAEKQACSFNKLAAFIGQHLTYPAEAKKAGVEGMAVVSFVVRADGSLDQLEVLKDPGAGCGEAALAVLRQMPSWVPGAKEGKAVDVEMKLPVQFRLPAEKEEEVFKVVEEMPRFPGCEHLEAGAARDECATGRLLQFVGENILYPEAAREAKTEGTVVLRFVIDKAGRPVKPGIVRSAGQAFDEEVLRVFHLLPDWTPGRQNGKEVNVEMVLPVKFRFTEKRENDEDARLLQLDNFRLAPNPASAYVDLSFRAGAAPIVISITDLNGRRVYRQYNENFNGDFQERIDLSQAPKGTLLLQIRQEKQVFSRQFIRQ